MKEYCAAVVLAAGQGKRMGTKVHKQYLLMGGKPVLYYSLRVFEDSRLIDEIILVCGAGEEDYCRQQIVKKYGISGVPSSFLIDPQGKIILTNARGGWLDTKLIELFEK